MVLSIICFEENPEFRNVSSVPPGFVVGLENVKNIHHKHSYIHLWEIVLEYQCPSNGPCAGVSGRAQLPANAIHHSPGTSGYLWASCSGSAAPPVCPGSVFPPGTLATQLPLLHSHLQSNMFLCPSCHSYGWDKICIKVEGTIYTKKKKGELRNLWVLSPCWMAGLSCTFCRRCPHQSDLPWEGLDSRPAYAVEVR